MKFSCDNCHARYSIADEKLRGKVVRVRCKRCGNSIMLSSEGAGRSEPVPGEDSTHLVNVDDLLKHIDETEIIEEEDEGDGPKFVSRSSLLPTVAAPRPTAERTPGPGPNSIPPSASPLTPAEWFILVNREEIGPLRLSDLRERGRAGTLTRRTYVWREGQAAWERLERVSGLKELSDSMPAAPAAATTSHVPPVKARQKVEPPKAKSTPRSSAKVDPQKDQATRPEMPANKSEAPPVPPPTPTPATKPGPISRPPLRDAAIAAPAPSADGDSDKTMLANPKAEMQARLIAEAASWADDAARSLSQPKQPPVPKAEPSKPIATKPAAPTKPPPAAVVVDQAQINTPKPVPEVAKTPARQEGHMVVLDEQAGATDKEELELDDDRTLVQKSPFDKSDVASAPKPASRIDTAPSTSRPQPVPQPAKKEAIIDDSRTRTYVRPPESNRNMWIAAIIFGAAALGAAVVLILHFAAQGTGGNRKRPAGTDAPAPKVAAAEPTAQPASPEPAKPEIAKADPPPAATEKIDPPPSVKPAEVADAPKPAEARPAANRVDEKALAGKREQIQPGIERCVTLALQHSPGIRLPKVLVHMTVAGSGRVTRMHYDKPAFTDTELGKCIAVKVKSMVLPPFEGDSQDVEFPLDLSGD